MKTIIACAVITLTWYAAAPLAQQQPAPAPTQMPTPAHNVFVLTGCVAATTEAGTSRFQLTDASSIGQPPPTRGAGTAAVGTSGQKATYALQPVSGVNAQGLNADALKAQVGRRVEMVVRPVESPAPAPPASLAGAQAAKPVEAAPERFSVTEIRSVIGNCS